MQGSGWSFIGKSYGCPFCFDKGFAKFVSEGDSLQVIEGMCDPDVPLDRIGNYMEAIR
jgi:hypothetical protein